MKQDILNLENKNVGSIELDEAIFGLEVRADILHRVVNWQLPDCSPATTRPKAAAKLL